MIYFNLLLIEIIFNFPQLFEDHYKDDDDDFHFGDDDKIYNKNCFQLFSVCVCVSVIVEV